MEPVIFSLSVQRQMILGTKTRRMIMIVVADGMAVSSWLLPLME